MKILFFLLIGMQIALAQRAPTKISPSGETSVTSAFGKTSVKARIRTSALQINMADESDRRFAQCTYSRDPCVLTESLHIEIGREEVFIPRSAYADLGDIYSAKWTRSGDGSLVLSLSGGDASESYIVKLLFRNKNLVERRLYSGEDPMKPLEISRYYFQSSDD